MDDTLLLTARPAAGPGVLLTDLYELTMLQAYFDEGLDATATMEQAGAAFAKLADIPAEAIPRG